MSQTKLISLDNLTRYDGKIKELIDSASGNTTYTLSAGSGADASKIVLTPSTGNPDKVTVPYATNAGTVNSHSVNSDVPANAVFTDTTDAASLTYSNTTSGLSATKVQGAIDEVKGLIDALGLSVVNGEVVQTVIEEV